MWLFYEYKRFNAISLKNVNGMLKTMKIDSTFQELSEHYRIVPIVALVVSKIELKEKGKNPDIPYFARVILCIHRLYLLTHCYDCGGDLVFGSHKFN